MPTCIRQFAVKSILTKVFHTHINLTLARELILDDLVGRSRRTSTFQKISPLSLYVIQESTRCRTVRNSNYVFESGSCACHAISHSSSSLRRYSSRHVNVYTVVLLTISEPVLLTCTDYKPARISNRIIGLYSLPFSTYAKSLANLFVALWKCLPSSRPMYRSHLRYPPVRPSVCLT